MGLPGITAEYRQRVYDDLVAQGVKDAIPPVTDGLFTPEPSAPREVVQMPRQMTPRVAPTMAQDILPGMESYEIGSALRKRVEAESRAAYKALQKKRAEDLERSTAIAAWARPFDPALPLGEANCQYEHITDVEEAARRLCRYQEARVPVAIDTETTGLDGHLDRILSIQFCDSPHTGWLLEWGLVLESPALKEVISSFLTSDTPKIYHNASFDLRMIALGIGVKFGSLFHEKNQTWDTLLAEYVLTGNKLKMLGLKGLASRQLGMQMRDLKDLTEGTYSLTFQAPWEIYYACRDVDATYRLWQLQAPRINESSELRRILDMEVQCTLAVIYMEHRGSRMNAFKLQHLDDRLSLISKDYEAVMKTEMGDWTPTRPPQKGKAVWASGAALAEYLFDHLKFESTKVSDLTQERSVDEEALEPLVAKSRFVAALMIWRKLSKIRSTYTQALPPKIHPVTGRLHTQFISAGARTGRFASAKPNNQNIPKKASESYYSDQNVPQACKDIEIFYKYLATTGFNIRTAWVPSPGYRYVKGDYSGQEIHMAAILSRDKVLLGRLINKEDLHSHYAKLAFRLEEPVGEIKKKYPHLRDKAKTITFAILFGAGPGRLAIDHGVDLEEARGWIDAFYTMYPELLEWQHRQIAFMRRHGYVKTATGRRVYCDRDSHKVKGRSINSPIQGTCADVIKRVLYKAARDCEAGLITVMDPPLLTIHDEIVAEAPIEHAEAAKKLLTRYMEDHVKDFLPGIDWPIGLPADVDIYYNWAWSLEEAGKLEAKALITLRNAFDSGESAQVDTALLGYGLDFPSEIPYLGLTTSSLGNSAVETQASPKILNETHNIKGELLQAYVGFTPNELDQMRGWHYDSAKFLRYHKARRERDDRPVFQVPAQSAVSA